MSDEKQNNRADDDAERRPEFCDPPPPTLTDAERLARCRETVHGQGLSMRAMGDELRAKDAALDSRDAALREAQAENERLRFVVQVWAEECQRWGEILVKQRKDARPQPTAPSPVPSPDELLPCPFCGSTKINFSGCGDCGATARSATMWNKRAPSPGATDGEPDYSDEITQEQLEALNRIIPDDEFADYKEIGSTDGGQPEADEDGPADVCQFDGKPCYVDIDPDEAHWRCGTVQCPRPTNTQVAADSGTIAVTTNDRGEAERIATHYHGSVTGKGWMLANDIESALFEARAGGGAKASAEEVTRALFAKYAANDDIGCPEMIAEIAAALSARERAGIEKTIQFIERGRFLHDDAPTAQFSREVVAGIRRALLPPAARRRNHDLA